MKFKKIRAGVYHAYTDKGEFYGECRKEERHGMAGQWWGFAGNNSTPYWIRFDRLKDWKRWIER